MIEMTYRTLGHTGLTVSALALGTVELGMDYGIAAPGHFTRPAEAAAIDLVHATLDAGITFIDTARAYGESEAVLGKALRCALPSVFPLWSWPPASCSRRPSPPPGARPGTG